MRKPSPELAAMPTAISRASALNSADRATFGDRPGAVEFVCGLDHSWRAVCVEVEDRAYEGSVNDRKRALRQSRRYLRQFIA